MFSKTSVILALTLAGLATGAVASTTAKTPEVLASAITAGLKIDKSFQAVSGLTGWVVSDTTKQYSVVYTTADGKHLISGLLLNAQGANLTQEYSEKYIPKPDLAKHWNDLEQSSWVATGAKQPKSVVYAFMDPDCTFCHLAWKALQPYQAAGLQVRWVMVGFLTPEAAGKTAAILESKDPSKALTAHMEGYDLRTHKGGIAPLAASVVKVATAGAIKENMDLMNTMGFKGTPAFVYKDKVGKVMAAGGMPKLSDLPGITGLPEQAVSDPDLARFR